MLRSHLKILWSPQLDDTQVGMSMYNNENNDKHKLYAH